MICSTNTFKTCSFLFYPGKKMNKVSFPLDSAYDHFPVSGQSRLSPGDQGVTTHVSWSHGAQFVILSPLPQKIINAPISSCHHKTDFLRFIEEEYVERTEEELTAGGRVEAPLDFILSFSRIPIKINFLFGGDLFSINFSQYNAQSDGRNEPWC